MLDNSVWSDFEENEEQNSHEEEHNEHNRHQYRNHKLLIQLFMQQQVLSWNLSVLILLELIVLRVLLNPKVVDKGQI